MRLEVQTESDRVSALRAEVKTYEQRLKEALERRVLAEAEVMAAKIAQAAEEEEENKEEEEDETRNFIMMTGSDDEQEEYDEEEEARVLNDLELSYEGLELSSIMPVPAAVRLATGHISHQDKMSKADIPETGFLEREGVWPMDAAVAQRKQGLDRRGAGSRVRRAPPKLGESSSGTSAGTGRTSRGTTLPVAACRPQAKEKRGGCSGCSCCGKAFPVEPCEVDEEGEVRDPDAKGVRGVGFQPFFAVRGNVP